MTTNPSGALVWVGLVAAIVPGCVDDHVLGVDGGPETADAWTAGHDAVSFDPDAYVVPIDANITPEKALDLLLMIDNSNSMTEEQASVAIEIPRMIARIASGDRDGDGTADFVPPTTIHVGIVDSDMGIGNTTGIATCDPGSGDDGVMQIVARHPGPGCANSYADRYPGNVFAFASPGSSAAFAADVACVAQLGTDGCGFESELESPLKALSLPPTTTGGSPVSWTRPGYQPPGFWPDPSSTFGHGSDPATNGAFLRAGSVLAIVTVNDEDDCSTDHQEIFSLSDPLTPGTDLNLRCHVHGEHAADFGNDNLLYPISRYADGFIGLRADPSRLVYAAITGVPPAIAGHSPAEILADPAMLEQDDPGHTNQLLPACISPGGRGVAYPAIRMTQLAQQLDAAGARTTVQSICNTDFSAAFDAIIERVGAAF